MVSLVDRAFFEWTEGKNPHESMVSVFHHIRDIPYSLLVPMGDPRTAPEEILHAGRGSCSPKHYLLAEMYRRLNIDVLYATFAFSWNNPAIQYPPPLRELATSLPISYHLACRVKIGCRWVLVDATWDLPLGRVGFPVNADWDGYRETLCAVRPLRSPIRTAYCRTLKNEPSRETGEEVPGIADGEKDHLSAEDRAGYIRQKATLCSKEEGERYRRFAREFSDWLESVRLDGAGGEGYTLTAGQDPVRRTLPDP